MYTQVKEMDNLNLFIDSHYKYIVSIIRVKHILTLHLSTANWRILTTTGCCCKNGAALYCTHYEISFCLVESIPQFLELWSITNALWWNSNFTLLYRNATTYGIKTDVYISISNDSNCIPFDCFLKGHHRQQTLASVESPVFTSDLLQRLHNAIFILFRGVFVTWLFDW